MNCLLISAWCQVPGVPQARWNLKSSFGSLRLMVFRRRIGRALGTGRAAGQSNLIVQIEKLHTLIIWLNLSNAAFNISGIIFSFYFIDLNVLYLMCGSDSTNSLTLELNLFSSIKLFIYCSEQTTCSILIRHVVVVLSDILSLVSPALWRQCSVGDLQRAMWCDLQPRTANNFHGNVMSRLKFTVLYATVHRVFTSNCCCYIAVKLSWKTQKLDGCGLGSSTRPGQGRPSTAPQLPWSVDTRQAAVRAREHVDTWARGHNCVISTSRWTPACLGWPVS